MRADVGARHAVPYARPAGVFLAKPVGSEAIINVSFGGGLVKVRAAPDLRPQPGEIVHLTVDIRGVRVFDAESSEAVN